MIVTEGKESEKRGFEQWKTSISIDRETYTYAMQFVERSMSVL